MRKADWKKYLFELRKEKICFSFTPFQKKIPV